MIIKRKRTLLIIAVIFTLIPSAYALAEPGSAPAAVNMPTYRKTDSGYESVYDNQSYLVNRHIGTSLLPPLEGTNPPAGNVTESGIATAKSFIPGFLVDQYVKRTGANTKTQPVSYTIQKGDTLYRIANAYGVSVDMLMVHNQITDPTKLRIGQQIEIPAANGEVTDWLEQNDLIRDVFYATLTAYTAGYESTGKTPSHPAYGITASGAKVKENFTIAVDPDVIPLGSLVYIEGIGIRKAEDTGSAIKGHKIDIYMPDLEEALKFGVKKNVKVYVLGNQKKRDVQIASANP
jgi:3D (Asp-Asp-Asp) domain-containing protein